MHERGGQHGHRELHDLRGLEADQADIEPALRAFADVADGIDHQQQHHADPVQPRSKAAQEVRAALRERDHRHGANANRISVRRIVSRLWPEALYCTTTA